MDSASTSANKVESIPFVSTVQVLVSSKGAVNENRKAKTLARMVSRSMNRKDYRNMQEQTASSSNLHQTWSLPPCLYRSLSSHLIHTSNPRIRPKDHPKHPVLLVLKSSFGTGAHHRFAPTTALRPGSKGFSDEETKHLLGGLRTIERRWSPGRVVEKNILHIIYHI